MRRLLIILVLFWSSLATAGTYYIANGGSDAAAGTKGAPWAHLPGMPTWTGSYTPTAGDNFILKGGDTWHRADLGVTWNANGTSGSRIYIGVDQAWYTGASWTRPIFTCDGVDCADNISGMWTQFWLYGTYVTIDNIEFTGLFLSSSSNHDVIGIQLNQPGGEVKNCYFHGWTRADVAGTGKDVYLIVGYGGGGGSQVAAVSVHDNVIDGHDSYLAGSRTGAAIWGAVESVYNNYVRYVFNGINGESDNVYGNVIEHVDYHASSGLHCNGFYHKTELNSTTIKMYNNVVRDSIGDGCVMWYIMGNASCPTCTTYFYNNLMYGNVGNDAGFGLGGDAGTVAGTGYYYNNTLQTTNQSCIGNGNGTVIQGTLHYANIHCITSDGTGPLAIVGGANTIIDDSSGHSLLQSLAAANTAGYCEPGVGGCTATYPFAPSSGSSPTVGAGANESSLVATWGAPFGYDTSLAVSYDAVNHKVIPARTAIVRPSSPTAWDIGAYQYAAASPPTVTVQGNVKITGSVKTQ